jgi:dolichol-phosphate mannosyltransferase
MRPLVIVATHNERENVRQFLPELLGIPELRVLVVDDASPDGTGFAAEVIAARSRGRVTVTHRVGRPRGRGHARLDAIREALETDADVICQMNADLSHQPADLVAMLEAVQHADLVIGSRYVPGACIVNSPLGHRLLSRAANAYVRAVRSIAARDCTSGLRCWQRRALAELPLERIDAERDVHVQLLSEAVALGCAVSEVPITFGPLVTPAISAAVSAPAARLQAADSGPR